MAQIRQSCGAPSLARIASALTKLEPMAVKFCPTSATSSRILLERPELGGLRLTKAGTIVPQRPQCPKMGASHPLPERARRPAASQRGFDRLHLLFASHQSCPGEWSRAKRSIRWFKSDELGAWSNVGASEFSERVVCLNVRDLWQAIESATDKAKEGRQKAGLVSCCPSVSQNLGLSTNPSDARSRLDTPDRPGGCPAIKVSPIATCHAESVDSKQHPGDDSHIL